MFKDLMHSLIGSNIGTQGAIASSLGVGASGMTASQYTQAMQNSILRTDPKRFTSSRKIFEGRIEVQQVANGYVVNIGVKEGYEYTTHIASSITEVNEIIAAAMVAFQLENT
jgi:hypothetical protein